jgi:anti-sigma B factor antagonist
LAEHGGVPSAGDAGDLRREPVKDVARVDGAVVVCLAGELDLHNADAVRAALLAAASDEPDRVVVDLEEVTFLDSTVLGILVEARAGLRNRRGFLLAAPGRETRRALEVSGLDRHFGVYASVDEALRAAL